MPRPSDQNMMELEKLALAHAPVPSVVAEPIELVREIEASDAQLLLAEFKEHNWARLRQTAGVSSIQALRLGHHQVAQYLAAGTDPREVAFLTGRSLSSIQSLVSDPAFRELLAYYEENQAQRDFNAYDRLVTIGGTAMEILQERLDENPERFGNNELRQIIESTMDRSAAPAKGDPRRGGLPTGGVSLNIKFVQPGAVPQATIVDVQAEDVKQVTQAEEKRT